VTDLLLSYVALFAIAALIGFGGGWLLRAMMTREARRDVDDEIARLSELNAKARARAEPSN
jgi:hypothetical protein